MTIHRDIPIDKHDLNHPNEILSEEIRKFMKDNGVRSEFVSIKTNSYYTFIGCSNNITIDVPRN